MVGVHRHVVRFVVVLADSFPEFQHPQAVGVMRVPFLDGPADGLFDALGCVKIGLADFQMDDVDPVVFQSSGSLQDIHNNERPDLFGASWDHLVCSVYGLPSTVYSSFFCIRVSSSS